MCVLNFMILLKLSYFLSRLTARQLTLTFRL